MVARFAFRARVSIPAEYRTDDGEQCAASVIDISERGCRLRNGNAALRPGMGLSINIGNIGPMSAEVRWLYRSYWGIAFTRPLHGALVEHLRESYARGALPDQHVAAPWT